MSKSGNDGAQISGELTLKIRLSRFFSITTRIHVGYSLAVGALIIPEKKVSEGILLRSYGALWLAIVRQLSSNWDTAFQLRPSQWEEIVAGAFKKEGYEVVLTPRSGDHGRDLIAIKRGIGSVRILGSVKAYKRGHLVTREHVHEMLGVISGDQQATKGIIATTSDFAPRILDAPGLAQTVPYRLELLNGEALHAWLSRLIEEE